MLRRIATNTALAFASTIGTLTVLGLILGVVTNRSDQLMYQVFGWGGILFTGLIGTPVHELGHWLMCKLFGFTVIDVSLFRPIAGRTDGILGYVSYFYTSSNPWQRLGTFFVGTAPLYIGSLVILLTVKLLTPEALRSARDRMQCVQNNGLQRIPKLLWAAVTGYCSGFLAVRSKTGILRGIVCLYIVCSVSMHMTLSAADLAGSLPGFVLILVLCLLFGLFSALLNYDPKHLLADTAAFLVSFLCLGLLFSLLFLGLSEILCLLLA